MDHSNSSALLPVIQLAITPVILISGVGALMLTLAALTTSAVTVTDTFTNAANWEAFHLTTISGIPAPTVAAQLGVRVSQIYLAKHRVQKLIQQEIRAMGGA